MKLIKEQYLFEMSNIKGKYIKIEDIDFSFYFSSKNNVNNQHGIRVKICWNREKIGEDLLDGYMELHGNYKYVSKKEPNIKSDSIDIATARYFFKRYKVLFSAVWENKLDENILSDYLRGNINFTQLLKEFENIENNQYELINSASNIKDLERLVRTYNIFNMND